MANRAPILFIGSIPLSNASEVFSTLGKSVGSLASRYPDGETGDRINWVRWQRHVFDANPDLELATTRALAGFNDAIERPFYRLKSKADLGQFAFKPLGYAARAAGSYKDFRRLKQAGVVPPEVKFQVCLPTALSLLTVFVELEDRASVEQALESALQREIEEIANEVPHHELVIQWDVCHELIGHDGGIDLHLSDILEEASERCARLVDFVPGTVEVGLHLCYGDPGHKHIIEPKDTGSCVAFAKRIASKARRNIGYVHIPIPRNFKSPEYYKPLSALDLAKDTAVYLGLVHYTDDLAGTQERISCARRYLPQFGIATECGFGRRDPKTTDALLDLHRQVAVAANLNAERV